MRDFMEQAKLSVQLPKKKAVFQLNRTRIGVPFFYVGIWLVFICIPLSVQSYWNAEGVLGELAVPIYFVYFLFVFFPIFAGAIYFLLAAIAAIALTLAKLLERKLTFLMMFKLASFAATFPLIGYGVFLFIDEGIATLWIWPSVAFLFFVLVRSIFHYPKQKNKRKGLMK
ncbi:hypothetical protein MM326_04900 [Alkalihalobacillus sp. LMS6]|uniref:hypothetical protein n=1 Tax=Bacillaceae TaxID=186817 RepID=UPI001145B7AE|nr:MULTISPECIES: hypothetical protein [Bacillaceae]UTR07373.1 hypothetical protein MM326_04900 [Alkalihalobacillus sp. LMS6]